MKAHAAEVVPHLTEQHKPMVMTQNGEATAVIQDVAAYEETQETLSLLKILLLGNRQIEKGRIASVPDVVNRLRKKKTRG